MITKNTRQINPSTIVQVRSKVHVGTQPFGHESLSRQEFGMCRVILAILVLLPTIAACQTPASHDWLLIRDLRAMSTESSTERGSSDGSGLWRVAVVKFDRNPDLVGHSRYLNDNESRAIDVFMSIAPYSIVINAPVYLYDPSVVVELSRGGSRWRIEDGDGRMFVEQRDSRLGRIIHEIKSGNGKFGGFDGSKFNFDELIAYISQVLE